MGKLVFLVFLLISSQNADSKAVVPKQKASAARLTVSILRFFQPNEKEYTQAARKAIEYLRNRGGGVLTYPTGTFMQGPLEITGSNITVLGAGVTKTRIIRNESRGYAFLANNKQRVYIKNLSIDCDKSPFEGGIYYGGCMGCWGEYVTVENADAATFVVSGILLNSNGQRGVSKTNGFRHCTAMGQKRYHEVGGKSPFIAGDYAQSTQFEYCVVKNCTGDAYDSDNAPGSVFENCAASFTKGISSYTGFWAEGEQTDSDHRVTWINCQASGFTNGFGLSEQAKGNIKAGRAEDCTHAIRGINYKYRITVDGFTARRCGKGLESIDTDGALSFTGPVTLLRVTTVGTLARNSFCNYAGGDFTVEETILGAGSIFDKDVFVSYGSTGSRRIVLDGVTMNNSSVRYYNADQTELLIKATRFNNGGVIGARIKKSRITGNSFFVTKNEKDAAISLNLDNFNTTVDNTTFQGYNQVGTNVRVGTGIKGIGLRSNVH